MKTIKEKANAKINLYLDVLAKREDGFHDIRTVMHSVTFGDTVTVTVSPAAETAVTMSVEGNRFLPTDARNLAARAAYLFLERARIRAEVNISLVKRIPVAAGLAGGSSDAAAVLRALNKLYGRIFSISALNEIAAELGSDVVYCLYGKCALCEGRGEVMTRLNVSVPGYVVIAIGNEHMSTPTAYKSLDSIYSDFDGTHPTGGEERFARLMPALREDRIDPEGMFNVFEEAILPLCPTAKAIRARLVELGARAAMMSGSGPSVFGIFDTLDQAVAACMELRKQRYRAYHAKFV
jgi:4-diphosphocytidyl-2-C-methyl-D-erythritol kinase